MSEAAKILPKIHHLLEKRTVLDLGCGSQKVVPWAVGVDDLSEWTPSDLTVDVDVSVSPSKKPLLLDALTHRGHPVTYDIVFSSHTLEHMREPILETLRWWFRFVASGGMMILYLPDERHYMYSPANPKERNPAHYHYLTPEIFRWYLDQLHGAKIDEILEDVGPDRYSFLAVIEKV